MLKSARNFTIFVLLLCIGASSGTALAVGTNFRNQNLTDRNFMGANLAGADFSGANLTGTMFAHANLAGAKFARAKIGRSDKGPTDFVHANLSKANFAGVQVKNGVNMQFATVSGTNFTRVDTTKILFGPRLYFTAEDGRPNFSRAKLDCQFPWLWEQVITTGATLPQCNFTAGTPPGGKAIAPATMATAEAASNAPPPSIRTQPALARDLKPAQPKKAMLTASGNTVNVSIGGSNSSTCGPASQPCHDIQYAISQCVTLGTPCTVQLDTRGVFSVASTITLANNVSLDGGYLGGVKIPNAQSSISATPAATPLMTGSGVTLTLSDLLLTGASGPTYPAASVVLALTLSSNVTVTGSGIYAGTGANASAGTSGSPGAPGGAGGNYTTQTGGSSSCWGSGGQGAQGWPVSASCSYNWRTVECDNSCGVTSNWGQQAFGQWGSGASGGAPSPNPNATACANGPSISSASAGQAGANASGTATPSSDRIGSFSASGAWTPLTGQAGNQGSSGSGGGGGGAGVANWRTWQNFDCNCSSQNGMGGGGGGGGGCAASIGAGGQMGGGSFGVIVAGSSLDMSNDVTLSGAQGGTGGTGGNGAQGGAGGIGGANCNCILANGTQAANCTPNCNGAASSGAGGNGGNGGDSGGGAGGNGGPSIGIVMLANSTVKKPKGIYPGASGVVGNGGGNGGGGGPIGANGLSGLAQGAYAPQ